MKYYHYENIAQAAFDVFTSEQFTDYKDQWVSDEVILQVLLVQRPNLNIESNGALDRKAINRAIPYQYKTCDSLDNGLGVYRHKYFMFSPFDKKNRNIWFYKFSKDLKYTMLPTKEDYENGLR